MGRYSLIFAFALVACSVDGVAILPGGDDVAGDGEVDDASDDPGSGEHEPGELPDGSSGAALCSVPDGQLDAAYVCPGSGGDLAEPAERWSFTGTDGESSVITTPLVANLDDDDGSGTIDLCDTPDIIVATVDLPPSKSDPIPAGHLWVLDGSSGVPITRFDRPIDAAVNPALVDLDADGVPEIVAYEAASPAPHKSVVARRLVVFDAQGEVRWAADHWHESAGGAISVADLDADGIPEIVAPDHVTDADGQLLFSVPDAADKPSIPTTADLDLDGDLEVIFGGHVYDHLGELLFTIQGGGNANAFAAVANFDDDPYPEIYLQRNNHRIIEHDGTVKAQCAGGSGQPVAIHDLDGDGRSEILYGHNKWLRALKVDEDSCTEAWSVKIGDAESSGTAFDLLGDGRSETIFADNEHLRLVDEDGEIVWERPWKARQSAAYPIVVDVDNDGETEIVFVGSRRDGGANNDIPSVLVIEAGQGGDGQGGWAPSRRIWNQHAYQYQGIREDGIVPTAEGVGTSFRANVGPSDELPCISETPIP